MTIVHQRTVARSLPNQRSLYEPGNFVASTASATVPTSGALANVTVGGTVYPFSYVDPINSYLPIQAGTYGAGPSGSVALTGGSLTVGGTVYPFSYVDPINSYLPIQADTYGAGSSGSVALTGGSLANAPHWTSVAYLFNVPLSSSEPVKLFDDYRELGEAFGQIAELDEDDDSWIEAPVLNIARHVAVELMTSAYPVPQIFNHGPKSLVFNWVNGRDNLYLTISERDVSILISTPQKIKRRVEYSVGEFLKYQHTVPLLQLAYSEQQATITVSGTSE
jgi:hypothetical protein